MIDAQVLAFTLVAALMTMSPGPDTMLVVRNALRGGRRDGLLTVAGICSGLFVHALLSALGVKSLRSAAHGAPAAIVDGGAGAVAASQSFREGLLTNVLNPKVVVFYLALVPQFIGPGDAVMLKYVLLTGIHYVEGIVWLGGVALLVALGLRLALQRQ